MLGTGLTESLAAAAFARLGRRLLHLDASSAYGGCWRSLSLAELPGTEHSEHRDTEKQTGTQAHSGTSKRAAIWTPAQVCSLGRRKRELRNPGLPGRKGRKDHDSAEGIFQSLKHLAGCGRRLPLSSAAGAAMAMQFLFQHLLFYRESQGVSYELGSLVLGRWRCDFF